MDFKQNGSAKSGLTRYSVELAKVDRNHPVIRTLDALGTGSWMALTDTLRDRSDQANNQGRIQDSLAPLSRALVGVDFTLSPLEIVSIGVKSLELFPGQLYFRYGLATRVACAYMTTDVSPENRVRVMKSLNNCNLYPALTQFMGEEPIRWKETGETTT